MIIKVNVKTNSVTLDEKTINDLDLSDVPDPIEEFYFDGLDGYIKLKDSPHLIPCSYIPSWVVICMTLFNKANQENKS